MDQKDIRERIDEKFQLLDRIDAIFADADRLNAAYVADGGSGPLVTYTRPDIVGMFSADELRYMFEMARAQRKAARDAAQ
jgi:hypothetical protein